MNRLAALVQPDDATGTGPDGSARAAPSGVDRLRRHTWWSSVGMVYAFGTFVLVAIVLAEPFGTVAVLAGIGVLSGTVASALLLERRLLRIDASGARRDDRGMMAIAVAGGVLSLTTAQWASDDPASWGIMAGVVTGAVAVSLPRGRKVAAVLGGGLAATALAAVAGYAATGQLHPTVLAEGGMTVALGGIFVYTLWYWEVVARLDQARRLEGEVAVADERLRFAADLHDVQGHNLQVIALKSELAARLAGADPAAAGAHMQEVAEHARAALRDTRAVVQGYRRTSLGVELPNATRVLAAAGIDGRLESGTERAAEHVPDAGQHLLGLVVREATTNVLRHSRAGVARFALVVADGRARLQIRNDGAAVPTAEPGTGLTTLAERLATADGALEWAREGEWFTVAAQVPLGEERGA